MSAACPKHDTGGGPCYFPGSVYAEAANTPVIGCKRPDGGAACIVPASGCANCQNAIFEQVVPFAKPIRPYATCGHVACARREHLVDVLIKAALDAAVHLDDMKNGVVGVSKSPDDDHTRRDRCGQTVERIYAACEALGVDLGKHEVAA